MIWLYRLLAGAFFILGFPLIWLICLIVPKWRPGFWQKYGFQLSVINNKKTIWLHAVSFGEVKTIQPLIQAIQRDYPNYSICLSTGTFSGQTLAKQLFPELIVFYCPFDFYFAVKAWLGRIKPAALFIAETELWPELIWQSASQNIPVFIINARLTDKSVRLYKLVKPFWQAILGKCRLVLAQSKLDSQRFTALGTPPNKIKVLPNLKWDSLSKLSAQEITENRHKLNLTTNQWEFVLVAGSTHPGEEELILQAFTGLLGQKDLDGYNLRLILAVRHLERLTEVCKLLEKFNLTYILQSQLKTVKKDDWQVLLVDKMGELPKMYSVANLALLGGTWANIGGHNPLEACIYDLPLLMGPYNYKIVELISELKEQKYSIYDNLSSVEQIQAQISHLIHSQNQIIVKGNTRNYNNKVAEQILMFTLNSVKSGT